MRARNPMRIVAGLVAILCCVFPWVAGPSLASSQQGNLPKVISITSYPVGAHGAFLAITFCEAVSKMTGIKVRPLPADADVGRFLPVKSGEAEAAVVSAASVYTASNGLREFSAKQFGPQRVRLVFAGDVMPHGLGVKADSGIKTWADLKGKRVAMAPGLFSISTPGFLAYGGLTLDDVVILKAAGYTTAVRMVMEGSADACHITPLSPLVKEWEAAPYGLRYMPMDAKETEAWARIKKVAPFLAVPVWVDFGALGEGGPKWLSYYPYTISSYPNIHEEIIYTILKALVEGRHLYKDIKPPSTQQFTLERTLDPNKPIYVPLHEGVIKYAKEVGKWTAEHDALQASLLREEEERMKAWKAKN